MMKRLIVPNRWDLFLGLIGLILVMGVAFRMVSSLRFRWGTMPPEIVVACYSPLLVVAAAAAACLAWNRFKLWRLALLTIVTIASLSLPIVLKLAFHWDPYRMEPYQQQFGFMPSTSLESTLLWSSLGGCILVAATFAISSALVVLFRVVPVGFSRLKNLFSRSVVASKISRTGLLIGTAVLLFVLVMINNILLANGFNVYASGFQPGGLTEALVTMSFGFVAFGLLVVWPSWVLLYGEKRWAQFLGATTLFVPATVFVVVSEFRSKHELPFELEFGLYALGAILFLATVLAVKSDEDSPKHPSLWSLVATAMIVALLLSPAFFDYAMLQPSISRANHTWSQKIRMAFDSGRLMWNSNRRLRGANGNYTCRFDRHCDPSILENLDFSVQPIHLALENVNPEINFDMFSNRTIGGMSFQDGALGRPQLAHLSKCQNCFLVNVEMVTTDNEPMLLSSPNIGVYVDEIPHDSSLLSSINIGNPQTTLTVYSLVTNEQWNDIVRLSQQCTVNLAGGVPRRFDAYKKDQSGRSLKNITIGAWQPQGNMKPVSRDFLEFVMKTDVQISAQSLYQIDFFWDLAFSVPNRLDMSVLPYHANWLSNSNLNSESLQKFHLAFGHDAGGKITDLFLPNCYEIEQIPDAPTIRTLSFDPAWLGSDTSSWNTNRVRELEQLTQCTALESLYFSDVKLAPRSFSFLGALKKLTHLQIPSLDRKQYSGPVFNQCSNLESLTLLGKPDPISIREIQQLTKLKTLVISDVLNEISNPTIYQSNLQKLLNQVEVQVVAFENFKPLIPQPFIDHQQRVRQELVNEIDLDRK